jgi:hypothetical protein
MLVCSLDAENPLRRTRLKKKKKKKKKKRRRERRRERRMTEREVYLRQAL